MKQSLKIWSFAILLALCLAVSAGAAEYLPEGGGEFEQPAIQKPEELLTREHDVIEAFESEFVWVDSDSELFAMPSLMEGWGPTDTCYGDQLDEIGKAVYDALEDAFKTNNLTYERFNWGDNANPNFIDSAVYKGVKTFYFQTRAEVDKKISDFNDLYPALIKQACLAFTYDHPEYFWIRFDYGYRYGYRGNWNADKKCYELYYEASIYYRVAPNCVDASQRSSFKAQINTTVDTILAACADLPVVAKLAYFDNWLAENNTYNGPAGKSSDPNFDADYMKKDASPWNLIGGLIKSYSPVCEGYAKSFQLLCHKIGLPCVTVSSKSHMWNAVQVDGKWYYVDCTWDDPGTTNTQTWSTRTWFLIHNLYKNDENSSHQIYMNFAHPSIGNSDYFSTNTWTMQDATVSGYMDTTTSALGSKRYLIALYNSDQKMVSVGSCVAIPWGRSSQRLIPPDFRASAVQTTANGKVFELTDSWTLANSSQEATPITKQ